MVESLRKDKASIVSGDIHPGIYVISANTNSRLGNDIRALISLGSDIYSSSEVIGSKFLIPGLDKIAAWGDIVSVDYKSRTVRTILSKKANQNTILVTEECNNLCVFCSQPPKPSGNFYSDALLAISNFDGDGVVGITGGEPTLFWDDFILFFTEILRKKPDQTFHLLTHGRSFHEVDKVRELQSTGGLRNILFASPLHAANAGLHDKITGVAGSFDETLTGLLNLAFCGATLEIRVVVNRHNYKSIPQVVSFVRSRLRTANYIIALMQLEPTGWAKNRYDQLYVSADEQGEYLSEALTASTTYGQDIVLFNYPLCHVPTEARPYAARSISDWKNYFPAKCDLCTLRKDCGGFFASAKGRVIEDPRPEL
jgi:His-Xaa-Ser system radical SAM maturase HxsC